MLRLSVAGHRWKINETETTLATVIDYDKKVLISVSIFKMKNRVFGCQGISFAVLNRCEYYCPLFRFERNASVDSLISFFCSSDFLLSNMLTIKLTLPLELNVSRCLSTKFQYR